MSILKWDMFLFFSKSSNLLRNVECTQDLLIVITYPLQAQRVAGSSGLVFFCCLTRRNGQLRCAEFQIPLPLYAVWQFTIQHSYWTPKIIQTKLNIKQNIEFQIIDNRIKIKKKRYYKNYFFNFLYVNYKYYNTLCCT